jgi:hypothetical protein
MAIERSALPVLSHQSNEDAAVANFDRIAAHVQFGIEAATVAQRKLIGVERTHDRLEL